MRNFEPMQNAEEECGMRYKEGRHEKGRELE